MKTNIKATTIELTPALSDYVEKKLALLNKLTKYYEDSYANVEIGKITRHHKAGEVFFAEINLHMDGKMFREVVDETELYSAIDQAKDKMEEDLSTYLKKKNRLLRRSGRAVKNFIRGFYRGKDGMNLLF